MIKLVIALKPEALPIIDLLSLHKIQSDQFTIFANNDYQLIISGPGRRNAARATAYLHTQSIDHAKDIWLNLGIAGHRDLPPGTLIVASDIRDVSGNLLHTCESSLNHGCITKSVMTVDTPEFVYAQDVVYEMEASGMLTQALAFTPASQVHVLKIISDNRSQPPDGITAQRVQNLVTSCTPQIRACLKNMADLGSF